MMLAPIRVCEIVFTCGKLSTARNLKKSNLSSAENFHIPSTVGCTKIRGGGPHDTWSEKLALNISFSKETIISVSHQGIVWMWIEHTLHRDIIRSVIIASCIANP